MCLNKIYSKSDSSPNQSEVFSFQAFSFVKADQKDQKPSERLWWSLSRIHTSDIVNSPGIWLCYSLACWLISEEKCVCAAMSEDKTPSDSRQWNHGEQKLTYTKDATTLSHSKYHLEWVKDVITPRKPSQKSAALFGWWPPQRKKNWVFFFVFAPEAQRLFPWAPVHCFYPTNCTAVM